jgi:hypothetical protein
MFGRMSPASQPLRSVAHKQQSRQPDANQRLLPSPIRCVWGGTVWGSRIGVQAKRPAPTKRGYPVRDRPQAAFSWRWNSNSKAVGGTQPTALPPSPYVPCSRTACAQSSDQPVNDVRLAFTCVLVLPFKAGRAVRREDNKCRATVLKGACELSPCFALARFCCRRLRLFRPAIPQPHLGVGVRVDQVRAAARAEYVPSADHHRDRRRCSPSTNCPSQGSKTTSSRPM